MPKKKAARPKAKPSKPPKAPAKARAPGGGGRKGGDAAGVALDSDAEKISQKERCSLRYDSEIIKELFDDTGSIREKLRELESFVLYGADYGESEERLKLGFWMLVNAWGRSTLKYVHIYRLACERANRERLIQRGFDDAFADRVSSWCSQLAKWTGELMAEHYARLGQEDAAWTRPGKHRKTTHQTTSLLAEYLMDDSTHFGNNPFRESWQTHRYDMGLRSYSAIAEFVEHNLTRDAVDSAIFEEARVIKCRPMRLNGLKLTLEEFDLLWPRLSRILREKLNAHRGVWKRLSKQKWTVVPLDELAKSKIWDGIFKQRDVRQHLDNGGWKIWLREAQHHAGLLRFRPEQLKWSACQTRCKETARALLCEGATANEDEWKPEILRRHRPRPPGFSIFAPDDFGFWR